MEKRLEGWQDMLDMLSKSFRELCKNKKNQSKLSSFAAEQQLDLFKRICQDWREIALITRKKVFDDKDQESIDLFDVKCKEWGYLLKELFGNSLGTGDYGHLVIDHAAMLMRRFHSMKNFSQQGFEASHKDQRQLWLKATGHDSKGEASSIEKMLNHFYAEKVLYQRYCFREAVTVLRDCQENDRFPFYFRGCGWKPKEMMWTSDDISWIKLIDNLMTMMFGDDHLNYEFNEQRQCRVSPESNGIMKYDKEEWNKEYLKIIFHNSKSDTSTEDLNLDIGSPMASSTPKKWDLQNKQKEEEEIINIEELDTGNQSIHGQDDQGRVMVVYPPPPSTGSISILQMDLDTLQDGEELNDSIVDFFIRYTCHNIKSQSSIEKCHFFSSFFFTKLVEPVKQGEKFVLPRAEVRHAKASTFTKNVDIFEKEYLFIPVCRSGHWFMLVVHNLNVFRSEGASIDSHASIFVIDSIVWGRKNQTHSPSSREQEAKLIRSFIQCEWSLTSTGSRIPDLDESNMPLIYPKVPQQENGYDCGVFVLLFFESYLKRNFPVNELHSDKWLGWYNQEDALALRTRILQILLSL